MKTIHFHAVKNDLLLLLDFVERTGALKFVPIGNFLKRDIEGGVAVIHDHKAIRNLGHATADSSAACDSFLVCDRNTTLQLRELQGYDGVERVCVDQLINPDTVVLSPGGLWGDEVLLEGHIGTASNSAASQILMNRFTAATRKMFQKVKAIYVGPEAMILLQNGKRLTMSAHSPREYDLVC